MIYLIYMLFSGVMTPSWFSMMGDIVPEQERRRYFAKRNLITQLIAIIGVILLSILLDWSKYQNLTYIGFFMIFVIGFITRILSAILFNNHYYPPYKFEIKDRVKTSSFIKDLTKSNFGKFTLFVSFLTFGQWIAKPFFSVYMLTQLNFEYSIFMVVNLSSTLIGLFSFPLLGRLSDKFGNVCLLRIGALFIPFLPFLWMVFDTPFEIVLGIQILSGIGWTAFNLATANFIYDNIPSIKRGRNIALYNSFIGIAITGGGFLGSIIVGFIPIVFLNIYYFVFLLSGIIRVIIVIIFLPKIKEVRIFTKPILNVKSHSICKWLFDLTLRTNIYKRKRKKKG